MRVAAAQIECRPGDIPANLAAHLAALRDAQAQGAALVVFPELSLTDYLSDPDTEALARPADAEELRAIAAAAGDTAVSLGFIERGSDGRVYNAQALLRRGACRHVHRKVNLPTYGASYGTAALHAGTPRRTRAPRGGPHRRHADLRRYMEPRPAVASPRFSTPTS